MEVFYQIMKPKQGILSLYKKRGETPLECLERFKTDNKEYKNEKMTYAGRLDPLAEGLLLVLVGEECKSKEKYLGLDKEYEVDVLFGFNTDTYDVLGLVIPAKAGIQTDLLNLDSRFRGNDTIKELLNSFIGRYSQKYPAYSSKYWNSARSEELDSDQIESKEVEIKNIELLEERTISKEDLHKYIKESINLVKGDFRQEEILEKWNNVFASEALKSEYVELFKDGLNEGEGVGVGINFQQKIICDATNSAFAIISIRVNCTSGTYMRSLANAIGEKVGIPALALNIKRMKVGDFKI